MPPRTVRALCPQCGEITMDPALRDVTLVKWFGEPVRLVFTCPSCDQVRAREVASDLIGPICTMFREAGNPLIQLPPHGDLPWPVFVYDDILDFALSFELEMQMLLDAE